MRLILLLGLALTGCRAGAQDAGATPSWRVVADIPLPGKPSRFDYQSFDPIAGRLWIALDPESHLLYLPLEDVGGRPVLRILQLD